MSQYLSSELTNALGWTFVHSLWQGCLLMILYLLGQRVLKLNSAAKYWTALTAITAMFVMSSFTFYQYIGVPAAIDKIPNAPFLIINQLNPIQEVSSWRIIEQYFPMIAWAWLVGALLFSFKLCGGLVQIQRLKSIGVMPISEEWQRKFDLLVKSTRITIPVRLLGSTKVTVPLVLGYFKPVILMPIGIMSGLTTEQVEAILLHELSHIKRHDFLVNIIQSIIEVIFYYHPAIWWLSSEIRKEREHCCDDQIIAHGVDKMTYAHALTIVGTINFTQNKLTMGLANNKNDLLNRIKRLVEGNDQSSTNFYSKGIPLLVLITALMSFSWYHHDKPTVENPTQFASIPMHPLAELVETFPELIVVPIDTPVTRRNHTSEHRSKTTIEWTGEDGESHEIIHESELDSDNHWEALEDHLDNIDVDFAQTHDLHRVFDGLKSMQDFDFSENFLFEIDTLPEIQMEHLIRAEAELARAKEMLNNIHFDFVQRDNEGLSEKQLANIREEMEQMEYNMKLQMARLNDTHKNVLLERNQRAIKEEIQQVQKLQEEIHRRNSEFSTKRMEEEMKQMQEQMINQKLEMRIIEEKFETYNKELTKQLKSDGYLKKGEKLENFQTNNRGMKVNGKPIADKDIQKYNKLREKYLED